MPTVAYLEVEYYVAGQWHAVTNPCVGTRPVPRSFFGTDANRVRGDYERVGYKTRLVRVYSDDTREELK